MLLKLSLCRRLVALTLATLSFGAIVEHTADLLKEDYDFIVIGGGTAGLVVANRLTETMKHTVLVLEAGGSHEDVWATKVPFFDSSFGTSSDWNYTTVPQAALGGRKLSYSQGRILGGSSSINGGVYTRSSSEDYDRYAKMANDDNWSWNNMLPYFNKAEKWTPPVDHHNITGQYDPSIHSSGGIVSLSLPSIAYPMDSCVIQASSELGDEYPFNLDANSGDHIGIGWVQSTVNRGSRSSSATAYLAQKYRSRTNLHVLLHARVSRVLQSRSENNAKNKRYCFKGVEFMHGRDGTLRHITARKEVILSAGVLGTPHILQQSGIGNQKNILRAGINPLVHLPSVGQNMTGHAGVRNTWLVNASFTFDNMFRDPALLEQIIKQWNETRTGPLVTGTSNVAGSFRVPPNTRGFSQILDPAAGPRTAHYELAFVNGNTRAPVPSTGNFMVVNTILMSSASRGNIQPASNVSFEPPLIDANLMGSDSDMFIMREAIRGARKFLKAPAFTGYIIAPMNHAASDTELDRFIRSTVFLYTHGVGTSSISPFGANYGVVDPDLRVKKIDGIRVVDASVLPLVPAAHPLAAVYATAERGADLIKELWCF